MGYWDKWGGKESYAAGQQKRYEQAVKSGDKDLQKRLEADAARVGYSLSKPSSTTGTSSSGKTSSSSSSGKSSQSSSNVQTRQYFENKGYTVEYLPESGNIRVYDPKTGHSSMIMKGAYTENAGVSTISPDIANKIESTIASGKYTYTPGNQQQLTGGVSEGKYSLEDLLEKFNEHLDKYSIPYEQALRDLLAQVPRYKMPNEEELLRRAKQYADLQITPRQQALERALQRLETQAEEQSRAISAAYEGVPEALSAATEEARAKALESAIARGAGRSGVVDWLSAQIEEERQRQLAQSEAEKAAKLANIQQWLQQNKQEISDQLQSLAETRGQLTQQQLENLRDMAYARATGDWERLYNATQQLAQTATGAQQNAYTTALSLLPYFAYSEQYRQELPTAIAKIFGQVPDTSPSTASTVPSLTASANGNLVPLRSYAESRGAIVSYDPLTKEVIVNGQRFKPEDSGGYIRDGVAYVPKEFIDHLLGGGV